MALVVEGYAVDVEGPLMRLRYPRGAYPDARLAEAILPYARAWAAQEEGPLAVLVDANGADMSSAGWRDAWAAFFLEDRARFRVAIHGAGAFMRSMGTLHAQAAQVAAHFFDDAEEARAWLGRHVGGGTPTQSDKP